MSETGDEKPAFATGGYTGTRSEPVIYFNDGCYIPMNPALKPSDLVAILANLNGCIVGRHRTTGGAECVDCGVPM